MQARPVEPLTDGRGYTDHKECRLSRRPPEEARWRDQYRAWPIICPRYVPVPVEDRHGCRCGGSSELCSRCYLGVGKCMRDLAYAEWTLFVSREALGVAKSLSRITQAVAWGVLGSLPRSWLSRDRLLPLRGRARGVCLARLLLERL